MPRSRPSSPAPPVTGAAPAPPAPEAAPRPLDAVRQTLYLSLARALLADIDSGRYPVGGSLPPEDSLAQRYGVSRHTVRQALAELKREGVIWARAGIGTKVRTRPQTPRFFSGIQNVSDLLQFVGTTQMHVVSRREVVADDEIAAQLHCQPGQAWAQITLLRKITGQKLPLNHLQAYLRPEYADAIGTLQVLTQPIYSLLEARYGVRIVEVQQEITAAPLTREMARALHCLEGQAAMRITRYYLDRNGTVVEVGIGHYPSGRYTQRTSFRAQGADGEAPRE